MHPLKLSMQGTRRKLVHAVIYELIAILLVSAAVRLASAATAQEAAGLALLTSLIAMSWNVAFNSLFEAWERRQTQRERTLWRRVLHAIGFEGGLTVLTVPVIAWWLQLGWLQALVADLWLVALFLVYTFVFNWLFDRVFGLPTSAQD